MSYYGFSSVKTGKITLHDPQNVTGVTATVLEPVLGIKAAEYELTAEDIAAGEFSIPETEAGDLYFEHMNEYDSLGTFPEDLELHVTIRYEAEGGEETLEYTVRDHPEQGWGVLYWAEDEPAFDWNRPGYFRLSSLESTIPVSLVLDDPDKVSTTPEKIVMSASLSIDGRKILPEECEIAEEQEDDFLAEFLETDEAPAKYYYARLYLKRPDWAPEHGTIHCTVVQQLSDGTIWTSEKDLAY